MSERILIIDDDERLTEMVAEYLQQAGMDVDVAPTVKAGLEALARTDYRALVLDVMLPDGDGLDVCRDLRRDGAGENRTSSDIPILMLTARGEDTDRIVGLELGADDYLPKPFNPRELQARLKAIMRRRTTEETPHSVLRFGTLSIDRDARQVHLRGEQRTLTSHQFELLYALAANAGRVMTRDALMQAVRGEDLDAFDRSIDVHVSRIRAAIEDDVRQPKRLITVRGIGYVFARISDNDT